MYLELDIFVIKNTTRKYIVVMKQITSGNKLLITKKKNESQ